MKQQIKIVISYDDCEAENNHVSTHVYLNNDKISFIQNLSVNADVDKPLPEINLTFPSLEKDSLPVLQKIIRSLSKLTNVNLCFKDFT
jgi:hypothetical protein